MMDVRNLIIKHEEDRQFPYVDTVGKLTIGVGHNLTDNGLPEEIRMLLLDYDIRQVRTELENNFSWFKYLCPARNAAIIDMCFNLGITRFRGFRNMIAALAAGDFDRAADEMLDSKWARQVGHRANELSYMIRYGVYMED